MTPAQLLHHYDHGQMWSAALSQRAGFDVPAAYQQALAVRLGKNRTTIMRNVQHLKSLGLLCRVGSKKLGHWIVRDPAP